jgi:cell division protein FtsQ
MTFLSRAWQKLKRWFLWFGKAVLLTLFAGLLTWVGLQAWQLWNGHQQGELIQVKLVNDDAKVSEAELTELLRPQLGIGFWQLDLPSIRKLVESHPWVSHAEVSRFWPSTLRVEVVEQVPVARWGEMGFVNQLGEIFYPNQGIEQKDLIRLSAVNPEPLAVLSMLKQVLELINPYGLHVAAMHRLADESWHIWLVNGDEWLLPKQEAILDLKQLLVLYGSIPKQEGTKMRIDLRYRDGFAVKWQLIENSTPIEGQP